MSTILFIIRLPNSTVLDFEERKDAAAGRTSLLEGFNGAWQGASRLESNLFELFFADGVHQSLCGAFNDQIIFVMTFLRAHGALLSWQTGLSKNT